MEELYKYVNIFICCVEFIDEGEACVALVTRNKKYFNSFKNNTFYDFIRSKNIVLNKENFLNFKVMYFPNITTHDIFKGKYKEADLNIHFNNNIALANKFKNQNKSVVRKKVKDWELLQPHELYEICIEELFFAPRSTVKSDMIIEMKKRLQFLSLTVDHGIISKLLAIFEIPEDKFLSNEKDVVRQCKEKWKGVIKFYVNKASNVLDKELSTNFSEDLQIEVSEIKKLLTEITDEIDSKHFETPKDVASYWPELLKPSPIYVFEK